MRKVYCDCCGLKAVYTNQIFFKINTDFCRKIEYDLCEKHQEEFARDIDKISDKYKRFENDGKII